MRFLTPTLGPNSPAITTRSRSKCRSDTLPTARPTCNVVGLHRQLEHLIAVPDPIDLATLATSAETIIAVVARRAACRTVASARAPRIAYESRR